MSSATLVDGTQLGKRQSFPLMLTYQLCVAGGEGGMVKFMNDVVCVYSASLKV